MIDAIVYIEKYFNKKKDYVHAETEQSEDEENLEVNDDGNTKKTQFIEDAAKFMLNARKYPQFNTFMMPFKFNSDKKKYMSEIFLFGSKTYLFVENPIFYQHYQNKLLFAYKDINAENLYWLSTSAAGNVLKDLHKNQKQFEDELKKKNFPHRTITQYTQLVGLYNVAFNPINEP